MPVVDVNRLNMETITREAMLRATQAGGKTQKQVAEEIGLHPSTLSRLLNGKERIPDDVFRRLLQISDDIFLMIDNLYVNDLLPVRMQRPVNIKLDPLASTVKGVEELDGAQVKAEQLSRLLVNVHGPEDVTEEIAQLIEECGMEWMESAMNCFLWCAEMKKLKPDILDRISQRLQHKLEEHKRI